MESPQLVQETWWRARLQRRPCTGKPLSWIHFMSMRTLILVCVLHWYGITSVGAGNLVAGEAAAEAMYRKAIELDPLHVKAHVNLGMCAALVWNHLSWCRKPGGGRGCSGGHVQESH